VLGGGLFVYNSVVLIVIVVAALVLRFVDCFVTEYWLVWLFCFVGVVVDWCCLLLWYLFYVLVGVVYCVLWFDLMFIIVLYYLSLWYGFVLFVSFRVVLTLCGLIFVGLLV